MPRGFRGNALPGRVAMTALLALGWADVPNAGQPGGSPAGPGVDDLVPRILARLEIDQEALRGFSYLESSITEKRDGHGDLRSHDIDTSEVFFVEGRRMKRPAPSGTRMDPGVAPDAPAVEDREPPLDIRDLASCFHFYAIGTETLHGDPALRMDFTAIKGCLKGTGRTRRILGNLSGSLWVDPEGFELLRLEGRLQQPVTFGLGLLGKVNRFDVELQREAVAPGVYATTYVTYRATGRIFLARSFDRRSVRARSHFSPVSVEQLSAITSSPSQPPASDRDPHLRSRS